MQVSLSQTLLACRKLCYSGAVRKEESQEFVVPDTMPDIRAILSATGNVRIRSKDLSPGRVRLEARLPVRVAYVPEDGTEPRCLETELEYYVTVEDEQIDPESFCETRLTLLSLEARLPNPRKVNLRGELLCALRCYAPGQLPVPGAPEAGEDGVLVREEAVCVSLVSVATEKTFAVTDEFDLPESASPARTLLAQNTALRTEELRLSGSKLILHGSADSALLYLAEDGSTGALSFSTGFSQVIELGEELPEEAAVSATLLLTGAYYDLTEVDGVHGTAEVHLAVQVLASVPRKLRCVTDAYSNRYALQPTLERRSFRRVERVLTLRETLRERFATPQPVREAVQSWASLGEPSPDPEGLLLPVTVVLYYRTPENVLCAARHSYPVKLRAELPEGESLELLSATVPELALSPAAEGAEVRMTVEARVACTATRSLDTVSALEYDETAPLDQSERPSLVLLRCTGGDDLWPLAKENCSTPEAIRAANGLDDLEGDWQKLLLIPKTI
ncbi:MAG: DUF3794 domain-containing protein [Oscillospiraceae bacterium]|nr:DUF3794 domain-containing protein [Oscillospiraceae bacterium]